MFQPPRRATKMTRTFPAAVMAVVLVGALGTPSRSLAEFHLRTRPLAECGPEVPFSSEPPGCELAPVS